MSKIVRVTRFQSLIGTVQRSVHTAGSPYYRQPPTGFQSLIGTVQLIIFSDILSIHGNFVSISHRYGST